MYIDNTNYRDSDNLIINQKSAKADFYIDNILDNYSIKEAKKIFHENNFEVMNTIGLYLDKTNNHKKLKKLILTLPRFKNVIITALETKFLHAKTNKQMKKIYSLIKKCINKYMVMHRFLIALHSSMLMNYKKIFKKILKKIHIIKSSDFISIFYKTHCKKYFINKLSKINIIFENYYVYYPNDFTNNIKFNKKIIECNKYKNFLILENKQQYICNALIQSIILNNKRLISMHKEWLQSMNFNLDYRMAHVIEIYYKNAFKNITNGEKNVFIISINNKNIKRLINKYVNKKMIVNF